MSEPARKQPYILRRPGGEVDQNRLFNAPGIVLLIAGVTIAAFFLTALSPVRAARIIESIAGLSPTRFLAGPEGNGGVLSMLSPLISHMFIHASLAHLAINTLFFLAFGAPMARRMGASNALQSAHGFYAASMFLSFYLLSGVAGALTYVALHTNEYSLLVGASGGVSGLLGGLVRFAFNRSTLLGPERAQISPLSSPSVITWSAVVIAMNLAAGLFGGPLTGGANVAWEAHIGGYIFGLLAYPMFEGLARVGR